MCTVSRTSMRVSVYVPLCVCVCVCVCVNDTVERAAVPIAAHQTAPSSNGTKASSERRDPVLHCIQSVGDWKVTVLLSGGKVCFEEVRALG